MSHGARGNFTSRRPDRFRGPLRTVAQALRSAAMPKLIFPSAWDRLTAGADPRLAQSLRTARTPPASGRSTADGSSPYCGRCKGWPPSARNCWSAGVSEPAARQLSAALRDARRSNVRLGGADLQGSEIRRSREKQNWAIGAPPTLRSFANGPSAESAIRRKAPPSARHRLQPALPAARRALSDRDGWMLAVAGELPGAGWLICACPR